MADTQHTTPTGQSSSSQSIKSDPIESQGHGYSAALAEVTNEKMANADAAAAGADTPAATKQEGAGGQNDDESNYPTGLKLLTIIIALCFAVLCVALDNTIIATAIPRITDEFHSLQDVGWYGSAYLLTTCAFQLLFGKFYSFFSIKWVFLIALGVFELGSLVCGVAPNSVALIVGRAIAGLGSAGLFSGALIIIAYSVPLRRRGLFTGFIGGMYGIANVAGPLMGGAFTDRVTWRWCFYINLPLGGVTAGILLLFLKSPKQEKKTAPTFWGKVNKFDPFGTMLFIPCIVCLLLALQWGGTTYAWSDGRIIALFVVFGVLLIAFLGVQKWRGEDATVPPRIAAQRTLIFSGFFGFCLGACFFIFVYFLPIWFQAVLGVSATQSGVDNLPMVMSQVVGTIVAGAGTTAFGYYNPFMLISPVFMGVGAGLLYTLYTTIPTDRWIGYQIILGLGTGFGFQQPLLAAQSVLPLADVPVGTAYMMFLLILGGSLFVSIGNNVFANALVTRLVELNIPGLNPELAVQTGATQLREVFGADLTVQGLVIDAYNAALDRVYMVGLIMGCIALLGAVGGEWRSMKGKPATASAA